jgi:hypothetical protein
MNVRVLVVVGSLVFGGCLGGDDDDVGTAEFNESEPNDLESQANDIGNAGSFGGACGGSDETDNFTVSVGAGSFSVTLYWSDPSENEDIDLWLYGTATSVDEGDVGTPPGDSPARVSANVPAPDTLEIEVDCFFASTPNISYVASVDR